jgi:hypothetical protein
VPISSEAARESALETEHISNAYHGSHSPVITAASGLSISVSSEEHELRNWIFEAVDTPAGFAKAVRRHGNENAAAKTRLRAECIWPECL